MPVMEDPRAQLSPHLIEGEKLLWVGRPYPARHFSAADVLLIPFSAMFGGFAVFWIVSAVLEDAPLLFVLWGLPFLMVGLYMILGRFIYKANRKRRTVYGLTERRALAAVDRGSLAETPLHGTPISQQPSRRGQHLTVTFGATNGGLPGALGNANTGMEFFTGGSAPLGFYDVRDVAGLQNALRGMTR